MNKRIVIIPDVHIPYHDRKAVKAIIRFIGDTQPDEVLMTGDVLDFPQPSRWNKDTRGEFEGSIYADVRIAQRDLFDPLRKVYPDKPTKLIPGNHDLRPKEYLEKYSPALSGTRAFDVDVLCDFDSYGIETVGPFYDVAPGWVATHGHKGGIRLSQNAGATALNAAKKFKRSVIMGHTHRLGIMSDTGGYDGKTETVTGVEVGHMMDQRLADYLKSGTANWQRGFATLDIDGKTVTPSIIPMIGNRFTVDGRTWEL
jgi:predicted phosphodiesterase